MARMVRYSITNEVGNSSDFIKIKKFTTNINQIKKLKTNL